MYINATSKFWNIVESEICVKIGVVCGFNYDKVTKAQTLSVSLKKTIL